MTIKANVTPEKIKKTRLELGLTQKQAADCLYINIASWQRYETPAHLNTHHSISRAYWELFLLKNRQKK